MTTPFENFVNTALGKSVSADVTLPTADEIPVFTGIGRQVTGKTATELGLALTADLDTDGTLAANSDTKYPSQKAVKTYADTKQAALLDVITSGTYGSSTQVPVITFNAKGIATTVNLATIAAPVLTEANFSVAKTGEPTYTVSWVLTALTGARAWTIPDKAINFGDLSSVASTGGNVLSGTRTRIVGGLANTVSGTDNIAVNSTSATVSNNRNGAYNCEASSSLTMSGSYCTAINFRPTGATISGTGITIIGGVGYNISVPDNNSIILGSSTQTNLFIFGTAATRRLNGLWASITTIPVAGTAYATIDGSQTLSNANCLKAVPQSGGTASHEVEFIVSVGLANGYGGCNPIGSFIAKRSINVHQTIGSGTYYTGTMRTIGTDESLGTISGTFTPSLTVDTVNNRLVCSVVRAGGVAGQEAFALSVRTSTHDSR